MRHTMKRLITYFVAASFACLGVMQPAQAALIGAGQVVAAADAQQNRAHIAALLERPAVQARLQELGIGKADAQQRVAALTDDEAAALADKIDSLPAGGDGVIGALIFVFLVLLVTDILGFTKVFPFTHPVRR
ncbi:MAG: PA2779 family protein [Rhodocyclaceae bacterium]|nr:PA2779 family protein [Rhodocyclaceae bacterium]